MTPVERLFDPSHAFDHPVTVGIVAFIFAGLVCATILLGFLNSAQKLNEKTYRELSARTGSWYILSAAMVVPILLGAAWVWGFFLLLSIYCFREFARATGLSESRSATYSVIAAMLVTYFAVLDHFIEFFMASWALGICLMAVVGIVPDEPQGYIRRLSLSLIGFALFGMSLAHLAYFGNDTNFRPMLLWLLFCTELNDVFAYMSGKAFGRRKLLPKTSPNKTVAGAVGAVVLTTAVAASIGYFVFAGTVVGAWPHLIALGLLISVLGQCGDLVVSSIKRDLGIKDMATLIPGHGGLLDRFDSLLIVAPCVFHYLNYFLYPDIGGDQPTQIMTHELLGL